MFGVAWIRSARMRHARRECVSSDEHRYALRDGGKMERCLTGGVRPSDNVDALASHRGSLGNRRAIIDAASCQLIRARYLEASIINTGRDVHGVSSQLRAVLQGDCNSPA